MPETVYTIHALESNPTTTDGEVATAFASVGKVTAETVSEQ